MGIRMSGLNSGLDTDAIVGALMSAQSLKKTKVERAKTKLEWKQTKWQDLNTKLTNLYNNYVSKMRLQSTYLAKKATMSDTSKANVTASNNAVNGSYTMEVKSIASAQYLTSAKISAASSSTKLTDVDSSLLNKEIEITANGKTSKFAIGENTTINDFTNALKKAGLNASYDTTQKRFFISSKNTGIDNSFSITSSAISSAELSGQSAIRNAVSYDDMSIANRDVVNSAMSALQSSGVDTEAYSTALDQMAKAAYDTKKSVIESGATTYVKATMYAGKYDENLAAAQADEELKKQFYEGENLDTLKEGKTAEDYEAAVKKKAEEDTTKYVDENIALTTAKTDIDAAAFTGKTVSDIEGLSQVALDKYYKNGVKGFDSNNGLTQESVRASLDTVARSYASITNRNDALSSSALSSLGLADITVAGDGTVSVNGGANDETNTDIPQGMALIEASDSKIVLNGAELTSSSTTVSANGLNVALTGTTKPGEVINFTVSDDVDGVYKQIKDFLKEYNSVMSEMYKLYNADSAKDYEPLTSEQKDAMSDKEVEDWETKIKDSLLRNDNKVNSIMQGMRDAMMSTVEVNGQKYALSSFGIMTSTNYTEGGQLHIYGDPDDSVYSGEQDKLKQALANDPDTTTKALSDIFENLRSSMSNMMKRTQYSSALTFYDDVKMGDDLKDYKKDIESWEDKLAEMEDRYYKKFTAMESAMAKLQSQQNSLAGLFGNS